MSHKPLKVWVKYESNMSHDMTRIDLSNYVWQKKGKHKSCVQRKIYHMFDQSKCSQKEAYVSKKWKRS